VSSGRFSIIALRFNPTGAFTAAPVYTQTGGPIIGTPSGPPSGGTLPVFTSLAVGNGTFSPAGQPTFSLSLIITGSSATGWAAGLSGISSTVGLLYGATWTSASLNGLTFTFSGLQIGSGSIIGDNHGNISGITSGSLTVTLSPQPGVGTVGTITGSL